MEGDWSCTPLQLNGGSPQKKRGDISGLESIIHDKSQSTRTTIVNCCKISFRTIWYTSWRKMLGLWQKKLSGKCTIDNKLEFYVFLFLMLLSNLIFEEDFILDWEQKSDFSIFSVRISGFNDFIYTVWILVDHIVLKEHIYISGKFWKIWTHRTIFHINLSNKCSINWLKNDQFLIKSWHTCFRTEINVRTNKASVHHFLCCI